MGGALPTVVKGLVDVPVIGVPTSIGYGYVVMELMHSCLCSSPALLG